MRFAGTAFTLIALMSLAQPSRAGLYQFTIGGTVTASDQAAVSVGDPVSITYVAHALDRDDDPARGNYRATRATFTFPGVMLQSDGFARVEVMLNDTDGRDRIRFLDLFPQSPWATVEISLPGGTLGSDALPVALTPSATEPAGFQYHYYNVAIAGAVSSYTSIEVPEPIAVTLLGATPLAFARRRRATPQT